MRAIKYSTLLVLLLCLSKICDATDIQEDWIKQDSLFISQIKKAFNSAPLTVEKHLKPCEKLRTNLGYGYSIIEDSMGKGYISIFYTCVYKNKKLIAYKLSPQMPNDISLTQRYLSFYKGLFNIENNYPQDLYFEYKKMTLPLDYSGKGITISPEIEFLMTPFSGVVYGDYGGVVNQMLGNREAYEKIKDLIDDKVIMLMLHSINPATRLCAAEHYFKNAHKYSHHSLIKRMIESNYKELPTIQTMSGCIRIEDNSKNVVKRIINQK